MERESTSYPITLIGRNHKPTAFLCPQCNCEIALRKKNCACGRMIAWDITEQLLMEKK